MQVNISEILSNPLSGRDFDAAVDFSCIAFKGRTFPVTGKRPFKLKVWREDKFLRVSAKTEVSINIPCDRCLEDVSFTFPVAVDYKINTADLSDHSDKINDDDEYSFIDGCMLDVDKLISDEVVVALPTKVLCKEDCKGLCPVCGTNLNHGSCDCDRDVPDPRMAAIRDIFRNYRGE